MALFIIKGIFCLMLIGAAALCFCAARGNISIVIFKPKRRSDMCDFSLDFRNTRLAVKGEQLFIHRFDTESNGLASRADFLAARPGFIKRFAHFFMRPGEKNPLDLPALCVPPGARLRISGIPKWIQEKYKVSAVEDVIFTQVTHEPFEHRDAVRFSNGRTLLLQRFPEGIRFEVLQVEMEEEPNAAPIKTTRSSIFDAIPQRR